MIVAVIGLFFLLVAIMSIVISVTDPCHDWSMMFFMSLLVCIICLIGDLQGTEIIIAHIMSLPWVG